MLLFSNFNPGTNMPQTSTAPLVMEQLLSTIIPGNNFHYRWILDEEIANAIKDDKGSIITNYSNLNRLISRKWSFHKGRQVVNQYCITKFTRSFRNNTRPILTFYYITRPTNEVVVPPLKSPTWLQIYNFYIQHPSGTNDTTSISVGQESNGKTTGSPKKNKEQGRNQLTLIKLHQLKSLLLYLN